jgi:uncharacterized protein (TIGR02246 family)
MRLFKMKGNVTWVLLAGFVLASTQVAPANSANYPSVDKELTARLEYCLGPLWASNDAERFVSEFFTEDAIATASDGPTAWHGRAQNIELIRDFMKAYKGLTPHVQFTRRLGEDAAYQFVVFDLIPRDPQQSPKMGGAKSLYVWIKTKAGWRVAADHYSFAGMQLRQP